MTLLDLAWQLVGRASAPGQVGAGRIQGGWEYVWAAYGITWAALTVYAISLWRRRPTTESLEDLR